MEDDPPDYEDRFYLDIFGPEGILASKLEVFERRPCQIEMAIEVDHILKEEGFLLIEAGTGTGKTFSYLIPAILSKKKLIISTATKNLQEQLFYKDIPTIKSILPFKFESAILKGRSNYVCRYRLNKLTQLPIFSDVKDIRVESLIEFAEKTNNGDRSELKDLPDHSPLWNETSSNSETCLGKNCPNFRSCFVTRAKSRAAKADIVVVNHHLFFADLALRNHSGRVIPNYDAVIFDEAHSIEDVVCNFFGISLGFDRFERFSRDVERSLKTVRINLRPLNKALKTLMDNCSGFFNLFAPLGGSKQRHGRFRLTDFNFPREGPITGEGIIRNLENISQGLRDIEEINEEFCPLIERAGRLKEDIDTLIKRDREDFVFWCEHRRGKAILGASPIEIARILEDELYTTVTTIVFTSATLSTNGTFDYLKERLGLYMDVKECILSSHFDFVSQASLYIPSKFPVPGEEGFPEAAAGKIEEILKITEGRAFLLFTSFKNMHLLFDILKDRLKFKTLVQGERPKSELLEEFRKDEHSVLFATFSFWEGVDVKGPSLSCVIIDKLPFDVPDDPVLSARLDLIREKGGNPFNDYQVPSAIIALRQGLGRLIRSRRDRGIMAIMDRRIIYKSYGRQFLESLPPCPVVDEIDDVRDFFNKL